MNKNHFNSSYRLLEPTLLKEEFLKSDLGHAKLLKLLLRNKVSLLGLKKHVSNPLLDSFFKSDVFLDAFHREELKCRMWISDFMKIKTVWDKEGIDYIFIKSDGTFPHQSDNLDLLVKTGDFSRAAKILTNMDFVELRNIQEAHKKFYRKFKGGESQAPIHLHERVCWGVPYEDNEHLWGHYLVSHEENCDIHHPCPEDTILINIAHAFLEDHTIKLHDLMIIQKCLDGNDIDWKYINKTADKMHWHQALQTGILIFDFLFQKQFGGPLFPDQLVKKARTSVYSVKWISETLGKMFSSVPDFPFTIPHLWTRRHSALRMLRDPFFGPRWQRIRQLFSQLFDGFIHLKLGIRSHPSMFITFSGLDGSGKTRHCEALEKAFKTCEIRTKVVWSRSGSLPMAQALLKIRNLLHVKKHQADNNTSNPSSQNPPKKGLVLALWRILNTCDLIFFYVGNITLPRLFGRVIIADRYVYDSIIDLEHMGKSIDFQRLSHRVLKGLAPKPELVIYLDTDIDTILKRGCEDPKELLKKTAVSYARVMKDIKALKIDNSRRFRESSTQVAYLALQQFFLKYPEKYHDYRVISYRYK